MTISSAPPLSGYDASTTNSRWSWGSSGAASSGQAALPIAVDIHELHAMSGTASSKSVIADGTDDLIVIGNDRGDSKFVEDMV